MVRVCYNRKYVVTEYVIAGVIHMGLCAISSGTGHCGVLCQKVRYNRALYNDILMFKGK